MELTEKVQDETSKAQSAQTCIQDLREQLDEARQDVAKLTESLKRNDTELLEYRKDRHGLADERDSLLKMVERRNFEVERLEEDTKALKQQLQAAINAKCETLSKYDEIQHKESAIAFKVYILFLNKSKVKVLKLFYFLGKTFRSRACSFAKSN